MRIDFDDFFKTTFLHIALNDESPALLYGIIAFAAYCRVFMREGGGEELSHGETASFLMWYNKSIMALHLSLAEGRQTWV